MYYMTKLLQKANNLTLRVQYSLICSVSTVKTLGSLFPQYSPHAWLISDIYKPNPLETVQETIDLIFFSMDLTGFISSFKV